MRPIHILLAIAAVVLVLIGGLVLWSSGDHPVPTASDPARRPTPEAVVQPKVELVDAPDVGTDRTVQQAPTASASGERAAPRADGNAKRVGGRVVDEAGKPVAGATVYAGSGGGFDDVALDEIDPVESRWFQRVESKTDAEGRFALDPRIQSRVRLAVRASGFAPLDVERSISESKPEVGDLVVQTGIVLEGRVIDHLGRPVAGAELRRHRSSSGPLAMLTGRGGAVAAKTDARGEFRIDVLGSGAWGLRITSEIAPDKDESGETTRAGEVVRGLVFQLEEGFEIAGRVSGVPANAVDGLRVAAMPKTTEFGDVAVRGGFGQRTAPIAADGSFVLRGCQKDGKYRVTARIAADGLGAMMRSPTRSASVDAASGDRDVQLAYRAETALTFQVVEAATGKPVTSMSVAAGSRFVAPLLDEDNRPIRNFPEGRVRYGGLRLGGGGFGGGRAPASSAPTTVTVRVEAAGYAPYERKDVEVTEGVDNDLGVVRLERTSLVVVRVTAKDGKPVANARVSLEKVESQPNDRRVFSVRAGPGGGDDEFDFGGGDAHRARTDAEGVARVSSIPGASARIVVKHSDFADLRTDPIDLPVGADVERAVVISLGGTVVVHVVDAAGNPVANESVEHRRPDGEEQPVFFGPEGGSTTDAEGRASLSNLAAGVHGFRLQSGSGGPRMIGGGGMRMAMSRRIGGGEEAPEKPWVEVTVTEGGAHEVTLTAPERARVVGRVREGGRPLSGATVRLRAKDGADMPFFDEGNKADTDGQGEYAVENVGVGEYVLSISHPSRVMPYEADLRVGSGETRENVDLPLSIVEGRVLDEAGKGVPGLRVRAERTSGGETTQREFVIAVDSGDGPVSFGSGGGGQVATDEEGRYKLRGVLAETDLTIAASGQGVQRTTSEPVRVPADGTRSGVDLVVKKGATLEVTCRRPDGSAATPCEVRAELQGDDGVADTKFEITRGDGKARFQGLKPGRWRVIARDLAINPDDGERTPVEQTVDLVVGSPKQVTLEVRGA